MSAEKSAAAERCPAEHHVPRLGVASPTGENLPPDQIVGMLREYLLGLPVERFPHIHRAIDDLFEGGPDDRFEFGIDVIVRGLSTYASRPTDSLGF